MKAKEVFFQYCPTSYMGADALIKSVFAPKHSKCMQLLHFDRGPFNFKTLTKWECK
jgi:hypothetical protein